ncbi:MAG: hypothetical protein KAG96_00135, partial [Ichthyobacteriaceae bacterium]|nr:hypothetical protein [Ichthyobacteriaceae bacterium]
MKFIYSIIFIAIANLGFSQNSVDKDMWYSKEESDNKVSYNANVKYNIDAGSSFSSFGNNGSAFSNYIAPSVTIPSGKNMSFTVGFLYNNTQYSGLGITGEGIGTVNGSINQAIVYGSGTYYVNENVTVHASGYYDINAPRNNNSPYRKSYASQMSPYSQYGTEGFSVGAEFKIGKRTQIGIQFQYDNGA